jgi:hypothetical protein
VIARLLNLRPHLRFFYMTGYVGSYTIKGLLGQGAVCVLEKPFPMDAFSRVVAGILPPPPGPSA